jgi:hypothetical protein
MNVGLPRSGRKISVDRLQGVELSSRPERQADVSASTNHAIERVLVEL